VPGVASPSQQQLPVNRVFRLLPRAEGCPLDPIATLRYE
jgi:hypothetical protein